VDIGSSQSGSGILVTTKLAVTGAPCREVNSKVATAPNTQVEDKDEVK